MREYDRLARIYNLSEYFAGHEGSVSCVAFSGSGVLASGGRDGRVMLWGGSTPRARKLKALRADAIGGGGGAPCSASGGVLGIAWGPGGVALAAARGRAVQLWDTEAGAVLRACECDHKINGVAWVAAEGKRGDLLACGTDGGEVEVWDAEKAARVCKLKGHEGPVECVAASGCMVASGSAGGAGAVRLWDVDARSCVRTLATRARCVAWSPCGGTVCVGSADAVSVWDAKAGKELRRDAADGRVLSVAFSPDGTTIASAEGTAIHLRSADSLRELAEVTGQASTVRAPCWSLAADDEWFDMDIVLRS